MSLTPADFESLLATAHAAADASAPFLLDHFRKPIDVENKFGDAGFDPVTVADRGAETLMVKEIRARHPDHGIVGEEHGKQGGTSPYSWVIDPIDGTRAFIMGSPLWGSLIGLRHANEPILGLMDQPFTGERFWSDHDASYMRRTPSSPRERLQTRACERLADAVMTSTHPDLFEGAQRINTLHALKAATKLTRYGGDCYHYCLLAAGFVDLIIESSLQAHDVVALIPIVERAGGVMTTWDGAPAGAGGDIIAAGDARVHAEAMAIISAGD